MGQHIDENSTWARAIRRAAHGGTLSHAMILTGEGGAEAARYIAASHLCLAEDGKPCLSCNACRKVMEGIHPDVTVVTDPEHVELSSDVIRQMRQDVYIRPNEGARKVYIFPDCDKLNERDQNLLLKVVEEGPAYAVFLFCAASHALLPTMRSRCVAVQLGGETDIPPESESAAALCRALAQGDRLALASQLAALETRRMKREALAELLQGLRLTAADALVMACGGRTAQGSAALLCGGLSRDKLAALEAVCRHYGEECTYNIGAGHVLGALAASFDVIL